MSLWSKASAEPPLRLFFVTDVHGSEPTFRKFINAARIYEVDALILGGDITGKMMTPIISLGNGTYRASFYGEMHMLRDEEDLAAFEKMVAKAGNYSHILSESEYQALASSPALIENLYRQKAAERLAAWTRLAEERLAGTNINCYVTGGNDDPPEVLEALQREAVKHVILCEDRTVDLSPAGHRMVSLGYSNPTPWKTPREIEEVDLERHIQALVNGIDDFSRVIFNFHVPPVDSTLDTCPMLDTSTDPPSMVTSGGQPVMFGAGSTAVREAIERWQPLLSLHGHIHESRGITTIGRTTAINPGSEYGEGVLRGVIVNLSGDSVVSTQLTSG